MAKNRGDVKREMTGLEFAPKPGSIVQGMNK
jgi:hypothetical protein